MTMKNNDFDLIEFGKMIESLNLSTIYSVYYFSDIVAITYYDNFNKPFNYFEIRNLKDAKEFVNNLCPSVGERLKHKLNSSENSERKTMQFTVKYYQWNELCNIFEAITKKMDKPMLESYLELFETHPRDYVLISIKPSS